MVVRVSPPPAATPAWRERTPPHGVPEAVVSPPVPRTRVRPARRDDGAAGPMPAVVLSCAGAPEGDMNLVRSLGEEGVPVIVVSEYADPPARLSRHCVRFVQVPSFADQPLQLRQALADLAREHGGPLPVFPSADPDLGVLNALAADLRGQVRSVLADPVLVRTLMDKRAFGLLAIEAGLPVPRSYMPASASEVAAIAARAAFPLIVKPSHPLAWKSDELPREIRRAKAVQVADAAELVALVRTLEPAGMTFIIQEFVPGDDPCHYDVHAYIDRDGLPRATCAGRKWRIEPPHAGSGCYVESVREAALEALAIDILQRIGYRGIANLNFKRHPETGEYRLLEINPRVSQWGILTTRAGVNLPWIAYRDVCGLIPAPMPARRTGLWYLNARTDARALRVYRRLGEWTLAGYLRSLLRRPMVFQVFSLRDPWPALKLTARWIAEKIRR